MLVKKKKKKGPSYFEKYTKLRPSDYLNTLILKRAVHHLQVIGHWQEKTASLQVITHLYWRLWFFLVSIWLWWPLFSTSLQWFQNGPGDHLNPFLQLSCPEEWYPGPELDDCWTSLYCRLALDLAFMEPCALFGFQVYSGLLLYGFRAMDPGMGDGDLDGPLGAVCLDGIMVSLAVSNHL